MAFEVVASSFRLERRRRGPLGEAARTGALAGAAAVFFCLVGAYQAMDGRYLVEDVLTLSQAIVLVIGLAAGALGQRAAVLAGAERDRAFLFGLLAGLVAGLVLAAFMLLAANVNLRTILVQASPVLVKKLSFVGERGSFQAAAFLAGAGTLAGLFGAGLATVPPILGRALVNGLAAMLGIGLFRDLFASILSNIPGLGGFEKTVFGGYGLEPVPAVAVFVAAAVLTVASRLADRGREGGGSGRAALVALLVAAVALPFFSNDFIAQVMMLVGLYALMSMGLHIELGLAGLVDLGFVAFYAVGAYTVALLCSDGPYAVAHFSFWAALPVAVAMAALAGFVFGLPVLRVRGDYLAMATLGLGEIVRLLVVSDALKPALGGSLGIIEVRKPEIFGYVLNTPIRLYFLALALAALVAFVSSRLQVTRLGRAWLAIREDEDVAQALGIDLVATKLLAYTVGAAFAGAAGAVFAVLVGAVYPHSFQLLISINLVAILVIGGLGSLPGVVVGTLVLVGLPEMLREFGEFRYLSYGIALVVITHFRAEGLWPAGGPARRQR